MKALRIALLMLAGQDLVGAMIGAAWGGSVTAALFAVSALLALATWRLTHWFEAATDRFAQSQGLGAGPDA